MIKAAYVHIPFCRGICSYCDFCKMIYVSAWADAYLKALEREIKDNYRGDELTSLYIGGGTPSALNLNQLQNLFQIMAHFKLAASNEVTFECNLNDINESLLTLLAQNRVNRLSIGIESFNPVKLQHLHRTSNYKLAQTKLKLCRKYGFYNLNLDLMYAVSGETLANLKKDVHLFCRLKPEHISAYGLIIEDHTLIGIQNEPAVPADLEVKMFNYIQRYLTKVGYYQYEISNYAKPGYVSRHNLNYWNNEEYYGFGLGASGFVDHIRYDNTRNLFKYLKDNRLLKAELLAVKTDMDNEIILGLRKIQGIEVAHFNAKFKVDIFQEYPIQKLINQKYLVFKKGYIKLHPAKLYVMNEILLKLV